MENRNRTLDLVINWNKHKYAMQSRLSALQKEKVKEALVFGKMVCVNHWNNAERKITSKNIAFYANNTLVYVDKEGCPRQKDQSRDGWTYDITGVFFKEETEIPKTITYPKPIVFQNPAHVSDRSTGRVISRIEVIHAINNGMFVNDHSVNNKGYVFYDRYYFCNDLCVIARETKSKITVATVYRITPVGDNDFLTKLSDYTWGLQNHKSKTSQINFGIKNETAEKKWHQSDEYWDFVMIQHIRSNAGSANEIPGHWQRRLRYLNLRSAYNESEENKRYLEQTSQAASIMKLVEFGGVPYFWKGDGLSFKDFRPEPTDEYSFIIDIEANEDCLTKRQTRYLKLLGFDPDKYEHEKTYKDNNIRFKFSMNNFCVNPVSWAHNNWEQMEYKYGA